MDAYKISLGSLTHGKEGNGGGGIGETSNFSEKERVQFLNGSEAFDTTRSQVIESLLHSNGPAEFTTKAAFVAPSAGLSFEG